MNPLMVPAYRRRGPARSLLVCICLLVLIVSPMRPIPAAAPAAAAPSVSRVLFVDTAGHWAETAIAALAARGIVAGVGGGRFDPQGKLTRAQLAKLIVAGLEGSSVADLLAGYPATYSDVGHHWGRGWVTAATELDLVRGYGDGRFGPDDPITRAQAAAVIVRALGWETEAGALTVDGAAETLAGYRDGGSVPDWAVGYVALAAGRGLMRGYEDLTLRPSAVVSRAEAAVLLLRAFDRMGLVFDIGGELLAVDDAGYITIGSIWGWPDDGRALTLQTAPGTACFRNGQRVQLADLAPHDTILAIMGSVGDGYGSVAPVLFVHALSWDVLGLLEDVREDGLRIAVGGGTVEIGIGRRTTVWRHGREAPAAALVPGDRIYALVDPLSGRARIVDAVRVQISGTVADSGREAGRAYVDVRPAGVSGPDAAQTQRVFLDGAFVSLDGLPSYPDQIAAGMSVLLAAYNPDTRQAGYCEAASAGGTSSVGDSLWAYLPRTAVSPVDGPAVASGTWTVSSSGGTYAQTPWTYVGDWPAATARVARPAFRTALFDGEPLAEARGVSVSATGAPDFWALYGLAGEGVTIAVVDTGADPSHPLLQTGLWGERKLVDWVDFTGEGRVETISPAGAYGGYVTTRLGSVRLGSTLSRSGVFRTGVLRESSLAQETGLGLDLNGNGRRDDAFAVIVIDSEIPGVYDTVLVDANGNLDLSDDVALKLFSASGEWSVFSAPGTEGGAGGTVGFGFVVSGVDRQGRSVTLGFDGNGHGTHVATVAAGNDPGLAADGGPVIAGMAPGASLMILKALGSDGGGGWNAVLSAVSYAARRGADLVVLAIESSYLGQDLAAEYRELTEIAQAYGMPIFLAAGNSGPGTSTAVSVLDPEMVVPVGGYISAEMWRRYYGKSVEGDGLWLHSAAGPVGGGRLGPLLLAPAAAVSGVPYPVAPTWHELYEGTSVAVPHVAGAAALLMSAARAEGTDAGGRAVVRCLAAGAIPLQGEGAAQQGYGVLSVVDAAMFLSAAGVGGVGDEARRVAMGYAGGDPWTYGGFGLHTGMSGYSGPALATDWPVTLTNQGQHPVRVAFEGAYGQVQPDRGIVYLPGGGSRQVTVRASEGWVPGLDDINDLVVARDEDSGLPVGSMLAWVPARVEVAAGGDVAAVQVMLQGVLPTGRTSRHYIELADGHDWLELSLAWFRSAAGGELAPGALSVYLYSPTGYPVAEIKSQGGQSGQGGGVGGGGGGSAVSAMVINPPGGLWEVVVWGEPGQFALEDTLSYVLALEAGARPMVTVQERVVRPAGDREPVQVTAGIHLPAGAGSVVVEAIGWFGIGGAGGGGIGGTAAVAPALTRRVGAVDAGGSLVWRLPVVTAGVGMLETTLAGLDAGDADLVLYHLAGEGQGGGQGGSWVEVGRSETVGSASERLLVISPGPGEYALMVRSRSVEGPHDVVMGAIYWPVGTGVLDQVLLQSGAAGLREISLRLPAPVGASGEYRAILVLREAKSLRPLVAVPVDVARGLPNLLAIVAPSLSGGAAAVGSPAVRARSSGTMQVVAGASLATSGRVTRHETDGRLSLRQSLLGAATVPGLGLEVVVRAPGHEPWAGQLYPLGADEGGLLGNSAEQRLSGLDGRSPYAGLQAAAGAAAVLAEVPGGMGALRLKITWQGGPR